MRSTCIQMAGERVMFSVYARKRSLVAILVITRTLLCSSEKAATPARTSLLQSKRYNKKKTGY